MGGVVQSSIYLYSGEPHECERVIRYMQRVAKRSRRRAIITDGRIHLGRSNHHNRVQ